MRADTFGKILRDFGLIFGIACIGLPFGSSMKKDVLVSDSLSGALKEFLHGSTLYVSGRMGGIDLFRINDLVLDTAVRSLSLSGNNLYYIGADSMFPINPSRGYYKNGLFQQLDLKKHFTLRDLAVQNDTVFTLGSDRDSITQPGTGFLYKNSKKVYFTSNAISEKHVYFGSKLLLEKDSIWIIGSLDSNAGLWKNDSLVSILNLEKKGYIQEYLALARYHSEILFVATTLYPYSDFAILGTWYWHKGHQYPIKYYEDGDDNDPNDYLHVRQFLVLGDSLLAVGDPPFFEAPSFLWVNGKATKWIDSTVEIPQLLGIASNNGILYYLGQYKTKNLNSLCIWSQGKRFDLGQTSIDFNINTFKIVDQETSGIKVRKPIRLKLKHGQLERSHFLRHTKSFGNLPRRNEASVSTADGKIYTPSTHSGIMAPSSY
jgi:hypothetical protein